MADLRGTWTARSLNLTVRTHHDGLFRDSRGPCGCGTRGCRHAEEDNNLRTETDKMAFFDAAAQRKEQARAAYCDYMDAALADEILAFKARLADAYGSQEVEESSADEGYVEVLPRSMTEVKVEDSSEDEGQQ